MSPLILPTSAFCADTGYTWRGSSASSWATLARWRSISASFSASVFSSSHIASILFSTAMRPGPGADVRAPDFDVALGDAGFGGQDEQHRVRVRDQVERQFRLGADGVQARRVEDHQALLEQRVREVDDRVAPQRDLDLALVVQRGGRIRVGLVVQAEALRFVDADVAGQADLLEGLDHAVAGVRGQRQHGPCRRRRRGSRWWTAARRGFRSAAGAGRAGRPGRTSARSGTWWCGRRPTAGCAGRSRQRTGR